MTRHLAVVVALLLVLFACGREEAIEVVPRPPDGFGWVSVAEYSDDYLIDWNGPYRIVAGSAHLTLIDGTRITVTPDTDVLWTLCDEMWPGSASKPCWLHVGLGEDRVSAEWVLAFDVRNPQGTPENRTVGINRDVLEVRADSLVLSDGTVLPFEESEVAVLCHGNSMDDMLNGYGRDGRLYLVIDDATGAVTGLNCLISH